MSDLQAIMSDLTIALESVGHAQSTAVSYGFDEKSTIGMFENVESSIKDLIKFLVDKM